MLICSDDVTAGSLSGGCLEEEVTRRAFDVLRTRVPSRMSFDARLRFGCNGTIEIFVETVRESFLANVAAHVGERRLCRAVTIFAGEENELGSRILSAGEQAPAGAFIQEIQPLVQLLIFGDGPDSTPLRSFAEILEWRIIEADQASDLLARADERPAAVLKSHNYGRDFAALQHLLQLNLRYVGFLGPRQRRDQLVNALLGAGVSMDAELFAPAGFDLGAETPEEIALAIISEIQCVLAEAGGNHCAIALRLSTNGISFARMTLCGPRHAHRRRHNSRGRRPFEIRRSVSTLRLVCS